MSKSVVILYDQFGNRIASHVESGKMLKHQPKGQISNTGTHLLIRRDELGTTNTAKVE